MTNPFQGSISPQQQQQQQQQQGEVQALEPPGGVGRQAPPAPPEEKELEIDQEVFEFLKSSADSSGNYLAFSDMVVSDPRVYSDSDLLTAILASDRLYKKLVGR